ncbi:lysylphosphatidylglycerol synthase domain-containing protein [Geminocystis sp. NIES-3709]|uniref:lysylphosphatidylglycerol synthase domain-containing protein n=1 Tax=Geminocystis sp. NIES-3709 TaxID=1617448 RepID=UPI0005FCA25A|nr:lysylphosphatidylglycerol synthase domain-containing protein [Geminocystis sp. NIES-3709]BAQ66848.1 putative transmembrane protein HieC [Geminocystis sp. NIES-3709]
MRLIKQFFRWFILGLTAFFIISTFYKNWQEVINIKFTFFTFLIFFISIFLNIIGHTFSAWVWTWILNLFHTKLQGLKAINIYLITNISKYLPGNVWHFLGRVKAIQSEGDSLSIATISVIIEPLLMAVSALLITLISASFGIIKINFSIIFLLILCLIITILIGIHPKIINPILTKLAKSKASNESAKLTKYPLLPLFGEIIFLLLRGFAFLSLLMALMPVELSLIPQVLSTFSFAWLLGLIVPGSPGGIGIFEVTIIATFDSTIFPSQIVLVVIALFRISSLLAEIITAGIAFLVNKFIQFNS